MAASESFFEAVLDLPRPATALMCSSELGLLGAISPIRSSNRKPLAQVIMPGRFDLY